MRYVLISRFNTNNIGDVLISRLLRDKMKRKGKVDCISLFGNPARFVSIDDVISYKSRKNPSLNILKKFIRRIKLVHCTKQKIKSGNIVVLGGGNLLCDLNEDSASTKRFDIFIENAKKNNCKIIALDIGIGPFYTEKQCEAAIGMLNQLEYISFRDEFSMELYIKNGGKTNCCLNIDPVFFLPSVVEERVPHENIKVAINLLDSKLIGQSVQEYGELVSAYVELGEKLLQLNRVSEVLYFITDQADLDCYKHVGKKIEKNSNLTLRPIRGVSELLDLYMEIDVLIGSRMHSMITGYSQKLPIIGFEWQNKVKSMFEMLELQNRLYSIQNVKASVDDICNDVKNIIINYEDEQEKIERTYVRLSMSKNNNDKNLY